MKKHESLGCSRSLLRWNTSQCQPVTGHAGSQEESLTLGPELQAPSALATGRTELCAQQRVCSWWQATGWSCGVPSEFLRPVRFMGYRKTTSQGKYFGLVGSSTTHGEQCCEHDPCRWRFRGVAVDFGLKHPVYKQSKSQTRPKCEPANFPASRQLSTS